MYPYTSGTNHKPSLSPSHLPTTEFCFMMFRNRGSVIIRDERRALLMLSASVSEALMQLLLRANLSQLFDCPFLSSWSAPLATDAEVRKFRKLITLLIGMNCSCQRHEGERSFAKFVIGNYHEIKVRVIDCRRRLSLGSSVAVRSASRSVTVITNIDWILLVTNESNRRKLCILKCDAV
jgi:hypothetical protein